MTFEIFKFGHTIFAIKVVTQIEFDWGNTTYHHSAQRP